MFWAYDHPISISLGVVFFALVLVLFLFRIAPLVLRDAHLRPQLASSIASIVIAVFIGVFLNNVLQGQRAREARRDALRDQHLNQLRPVLKSEAQSLQALATTIQSQGYLAGPRPDPVNDPRNLDARIWPETMSADLRNHFVEYDDTKKALLKDAKDQEDEFRASVADLSDSIPSKRLPEMYWRDVVAVSFIRKCMGIGNGVVLTVSPSYPGNLGSYGFGDAFGGGSGGGPPPPERVAEFAAYQNLKPTKAVFAHCDSLKERSSKIVAESSALSKQALVLSEGTVVLKGDCPFLKID